MTDISNQVRCHLEDAVTSSGSFSLPGAFDKFKEDLSEGSDLPLFEEVGPSHKHLELDFTSSFQEVREKLGSSDARKIGKSILRFSFFIEPVKIPSANTTQYDVRWGGRVQSEANKPRHASFEACLRIFGKLMSELVSAVQESNKRQFLVLFANNTLPPFEMPIDYVDRLREGGMHRKDNIEWFWDDHISKIVSLRPMLTSEETWSEVLEPEQAATLASFFGGVYEKVKTKSHLTDRVITGNYKTNREKRWEVHPESVHFAKRRDCLGIEEVLINQLFYLRGFPEPARRFFEEKGLVSFAHLEDEALNGFQDSLVRCPITLEPLTYEKFKRGVLDPEHGRSKHQVGHLHPLKATSDNPYAGHTPKNISWISERGNRIQGEHSVDETRTLLFKMVENYEEAGVYPAR